MKKVLAIILTIGICLTMTACASVAMPADEEIDVVSEIVDGNFLTEENGQINQNNENSSKPSVNNTQSHTCIYAPATCTTPKTCSCGKIEGAVLGHNYQTGVCARCGNEDPNYKKEITVEELRSNFIENVKRGTYESDAETPYYWINIGEFTWETGSFLTLMVYTPSTDALQIKYKSGGSSYYEETTMPLFISSKGVLKKGGELGISHKEVSILGNFVATASINKENYKSGDYIECRWHTDRGGAIYEEEKRVEFSKNITSNVKTALRHLEEWLNGEIKMSDIGFTAY